MIETIKNILPWAQMALAILLIACILLQQRGTGLSTMFGGEGQVYRTRRGAEHIVFVATIVFAILFFASTFAQVLLAVR